MKKSFKLDSKSNDIRIDRWIKINIGKFPQNLIEKNLRIGKIKLNNKKVKSSTKVKNNDIITLFNFNYSENVLSKNKKYNPSKDIIKINENQIIENNPNFIVINKINGISVQGGTKSKKNLIDIFSKSEIFENTKPYPVHRLDKDTSGLLIISKNRDYARLLTSLFRIRRIHKTYLAIVNGEFKKNHGKLLDNLIRYEGKKKIIEKAQTFFKVIDKNNNFSLIELKPITGRKHQIRKQLSIIGNPIIGDNKYQINKIKGKNTYNLMLHSYKIKFMINNQKYNYIATPPKHFTDYLKIKNLKFLNY